MDINPVNGKIVFKLKKYLKDRGIPMLQLSKRSGLDYRTVLRYCNTDVKNIKVFILESICKTLDCSVSDILEFVKDDGEK